MDLQQMSQLVRDLCRQHEMDRVAWRNMVDASTDHAQRIDQLMDEALQSNDQFSMLMDGHLINQKASEQQFREQVHTSIRDVTAALQITEASLRTHVDNGLANSKILLAELKAKFEAMDITIANLASGAPSSNPYAQPRTPPPDPASSLALVAGVSSVTASSNPNTQTRIPLLDPTTGYASTPGFTWPQPGGPAQVYGGQHVASGQPQQFCMATPVRQPGAQSSLAGEANNAAVAPTFAMPGMAAPSGNA